MAIKQSTYDEVMGNFFRDAYTKAINAGKAALDQQGIKIPGEGEKPLSQQIIDEDSLGVKGGRTPVTKEEYLNSGLGSTGKWQWTSMGTDPKTGKEIGSVESTYQGGGLAGKYAQELSGSVGSPDYQYWHQDLNYLRDPKEGIQSAQDRQSDLAARQAANDAASRTFTSQSLDRIGAQAAPIYGDIADTYKRDAAIMRQNQAVENIDPRTRYFQDAALMSLQGRENYQQPTLEAMGQYATGEKSVVEEQNKLNRSALAQQLASAMAGGKYDPMLQKRLLTDYLSGATEMGRQGEIAAMQERQQALQNLFAGASGMRGQDMSLTGLGMQEAQNLRGFDQANIQLQQANERIMQDWFAGRLSAQQALNAKEQLRQSTYQLRQADEQLALQNQQAQNQLEELTMKYMQMGMGRDAANLAARQEYEKMMQARDLSLVNMGLAKEAGKPIESGGTDWGQLISGIGSIAGTIGMVAASDPKTKKNMEYITASPGELKENIKPIGPALQRFTPNTIGGSGGKYEDNKFDISGADVSQKNLGRYLSSIAGSAEQKEEVLDRGYGKTPYDMRPLLPKEPELLNPMPQPYFNTSTFGGDYYPNAPSPYQPKTAEEKKAEYQKKVMDKWREEQIKEKEEKAKTVFQPPQTPTTTIPTGSGVYRAEPQGIPTGRGVYRAEPQTIAKEFMEESQKPKSVYSEQQKLLDPNAALAYKIQQEPPQIAKKFVEQEKPAVVEQQVVKPRSSLVTPSSAFLNAYRVTPTTTTTSTPYTSPSVTSTMGTRKSSPTSGLGYYSLSDPKSKLMKGEELGLQDYLDMMDFSPQKVAGTSDDLDINAKSYTNLIKDGSEVQKFPPMVIDMSERKKYPEMTIDMNEEPKQLEERDEPMPSAEPFRDEPVPEEKEESFWKIPPTEPRPDATRVITKSDLIDDEPGVAPLNIDDEPGIVSPKVPQTPAKPSYWETLSPQTKAKLIQTGIGGLGNIVGAFTKSPAEQLQEELYNRKLAQNAAQMQIQAARPYISGLMDNRGSATKSAIALSDPRSKENVKDGLLSDYLEKIKPVKFDYKDEEKYGAGTRTGVLSTDVAKSALGDGMVIEDPKTGYKMLNMDPRISGPLFMATDSFLNKRINNIERMLGLKDPRGGE